MQQPTIKDGNVVRGLVRALKAAGKPMLRKSAAPARVTIQGGGPVDDTVRMGPHTDLTDMPSAVNSDHDGRYYTESEVDGLLAPLTNYWQRTGTTLSPATAGDLVSITASPMAGTVLDVTQSGLGGTAITGTASTGDGVYGVGGSFGVIGETSSANNDSYGGYFSRSCLGTWGDFAQQSVDPAAPPASYQRVYTKSTGLFIEQPGGGVTGPLIDASSLPTVVTPTWILGDGSTPDSTPSSGTITLTADAYYANLTLSGTAKVNTNGYGLFVLGTLTVGSGCEVYCKGGAGGNATNASGTTPGNPGVAGAASNAAGRFRAGVAGVAGKIGGAVNTAGGKGNSGTDVTASIYASTTSSAGGAGGNGGSSGAPIMGGGTGNPGGNTQLVPLAGGILRDLLQLITGAYFDRTAFSYGYWTGQAGSGSGGSGAGGATSTTAGAGGGSGGSGAPGGVCFIAAGAIVNAGSINADGGAGGNGGNGGNGVTNGHGGGGGGGGAGGCGGEVILVYHTLTNTGTITAAAGAAGAKGTKGTKAGTGQDGVDGNAGAAGDAGIVLQYVI